MKMSNLGQNPGKSCFSLAGQKPSSTFQSWSEVATSAKGKRKGNLQPFFWAGPETSTLIHQPQLARHWRVGAPRDADGRLFKDWYSEAT